MKLRFWLMTYPYTANDDRGSFLVSAWAIPPMPGGKLYEVTVEVPPRVEQIVGTAEAAEEGAGAP